MTDLAEWLATQLDADERIARQATPGNWRWVDPGGPYKNGLVSSPYPYRTVLLAAETPLSAADAIHIALHDPVRALSAIAAHRAILREYQTAIVSRDVAKGTVLAGATRLSLRLREEAVKAVASSIYAGREGFDPAWKVEL